MKVSFCYYCVIYVEDVFCLAEQRLGNWKKFISFNGYKRGFATTKNRVCSLVRDEREVSGKLSLLYNIMWVWDGKATVTHLTDHTGCWSVWRAWQSKASPCWSVCLSIKLFIVLLRWYFLFWDNWIILLYMHI